MKRALLLGFVSTLLLVGCEAPREPGLSDVAAEAFAAVRKAGGLSAQQLRGRDTYRAHCEVCHGPTGTGDGFNAFNLDPHPRDLTQIVGVRTAEDLRRSVELGGRRQGLSPLMPPYGGTLQPDAIDDVVAFVKSLAERPGAASPKATSK